MHECRIRMIRLALRYSSYSRTKKYQKSVTLREISGFSTVHNPKLSHLRKIQKKCNTQGNFRVQYSPWSQIVTLKKIQKIVTLREISGFSIVHDPKLSHLKKIKSVSQFGNIYIKSKYLKSTLKQLFLDYNKTKKEKKCDNLGSWSVVFQPYFFSKI